MDRVPALRIPLAAAGRDQARGVLTRFGGPLDAGNGHKLQPSSGGLTF
jgi:hypothetical protein